MAANLANIAEFLKKTYRFPFVNMMREEVSLLQFFPQQKGRDEEYLFKIRYGRNESVGPYNEEDALKAAGHQTAVSARRPYRYNNAIVRVTGPAMAASKGEGGFVEKLADEMRWALPQLKDEINTQMLSQDVVTASNGAPGVDSIGYIVDDGTINPASTTYAEVDRTLPFWRPYILENGGVERPLSLQLMQQMTMALQTPDRKSKIDAILTSHANFNQYGNILQDQRRYVNSTELDGGFITLPFEGRKLTVIPDLPAGDIYFLDKASWEYSVLLDFDTEEKDLDMDARRFMIKTYSQLVCTALARQGRVADLPTT
jgi:hypothetical protein